MRVPELFLFVSWGHGPRRGPRPLLTVLKVVYPGNFLLALVVSLCREDITFLCGGNVLVTHLKLNALVIKSRLIEGRN